MARHHLVPQMYLRRFANDKQLLAMVSRDDLTTSRLVTVNNACNEIGYYEIPTEDLEMEARRGHDPEQVESIFANVEGEANQYIAEMLNGDFPPRPEVRFRMSMYMALQITRSWSFRNEIDELTSLMTPHSIEMEATPERVGATLRRLGRPHTPADVMNVIAQLLGPNGPRLTLRQGHYVQTMLWLAMDSIMPLLFQRTWRLLDFGCPMLLISDEPVAALGSQIDGVGIANSPAIWFPLDRQHALALTRSGTEQIVPSKKTRANQINSIVAGQAYRWIFHHPDDNPLAGLKLGPRMALVDEVVGIKREGDIIRELHRLVKRPAKEEDEDNGEKL